VALAVFVVGVVGPHLVACDPGVVPSLERTAQCRALDELFAVVELGDLVQHPPAHGRCRRIIERTADAVVGDGGEREAGALQSPLVPGDTDEVLVPLVADPLGQRRTAIHRFVLDVAGVGPIRFDRRRDLGRQRLPGPGGRHSVAPVDAMTAVSAASAIVIASVLVRRPPARN
jgi:hypothetical protein